MRARQLVGRTRRLIPPAALAAGLGRSSPPEARPMATGLGADPAPQSGPTPPPHETGAFTAVGHSRRVDAAGVWTDRSEGLLFLFHLHGFEALAAYAAGPRTSGGDAFWAGVIDDWLDSEAHPRLPSWHPFPTSNRIVAWTAALAAIGSWPASLRERMTRELWRQARYLRRAVEHDIGGNHVLVNAKALAFAGATFPASSLWKDAMSLLERELPDQVLADGGHEERSTAYHRMVRHSLGEVAQLAGATAPGTDPALGDALTRMATWEASMRGPDGRLALLNDAWEGPPEPTVSSEEAEALRESGYVVFRHRRDQAIFDAGPLAPPHLPPHAHADALSFVLWADGRPLIVDPGSYAYTGEERNRFRATVAHNTVEVDGMDQCELWGDFRAAFMPTVRLGSLRREADTVVATAAHDGYARLRPDPVEHHRAFIWCPGEGLVIVDKLHARRAHRIRSCLHLAPGVSPRSMGGITARSLGIAGAVEETPYGYAPFVGVLQPGIRLGYDGTMSPGTPFGWSLLRPGTEVARLETDAVILARDGRPDVRVTLDWCQLSIGR